MACRKVTVGELQRIKEIREIKQRKNKRKTELDDDSIEEFDVCAICDDGGSVTCCDGGCQRAFHLVDSEAHDDCREKLGLTLEHAKTINTVDGFICKNCQFKQHQCFACGLLGSSDDTSSKPEVFQCEHEDCAHFYHPKCIAQLLYPNSEEAIHFEAEVAFAGEKFNCLMHECMECKGVENKNDKSMQFAVCRRCPTVYHRKCLPSDILFKSRKGPNGSLQRAWDDILPDQILMYCMKHKMSRPTSRPLLSKSSCLHQLQAPRLRVRVPVSLSHHSLQAPCTRNHSQVPVVGSQTTSDHTPYSLLSVSCRQQNPKGQNFTGRRLRGNLNSLLFVDMGSIWFYFVGCCTVLVVN